ncbi:Dihydrofolate reductase [Rhodococcus jostii]|uniref:Dihydrofolate reductase n=2 Tax=Rhodococcus jostii TaxID=132919 RepID=A0A1H5MEV3_RHOJO|nr:Dihydrofolate reductase [Rhodococcus jostii]
MLIYSMSVSADGFIADREGAFEWTVFGEEQFRIHVAQTRELGGCVCGRRLTRPCCRGRRIRRCATTSSGPRSPMSGALCRRSSSARTLDSVQGNARLAEASVAEEAAAALDATDKDVSIGGAGLAAAAIELGLVDKLRMFRNPVVIGGGTPFLPPVTEDVRLDLDRDQDVGLALDLRALPAHPGKVGLTPPSETSAPRRTFDAPTTCAPSKSPGKAVVLRSRPPGVVNEWMQA